MRRKIAGLAAPKAALLGLVGHMRLFDKTRSRMGTQRRVNALQGPCQGNNILQNNPPHQTGSGNPNET